MTQQNEQPGVGAAMARWLRAALGRVDNSYMTARRGVKKRLGTLEPLRIDVYLGYAGPERAMVRGRALENHLPEPPHVNDSPIDNLRRSLRQLESDEVPDLELDVKFLGTRQRVRTDKEGYFHVELALSRPPGEGWLPSEVEVVDEDFGRKAAGIGRVLAPHATARFGVISDIDDTILQSHVQNRLRQLALTLLGNAVTRLSFEGTSELYRGLERAGEAAPFFYVSRSGWSVHAVLEHFIRHQDLPEGPLSLRHVGLLTGRKEARRHKPREIQHIIDTFPDLPFVLIGDSGQHDADIYTAIAERSPERVRAILIRNVSPPERRAVIEETLRRWCPQEIPWLVFDADADAKEFCESHDLWRGGV